MKTLLSLLALVSLWSLPAHAQVGAVISPKDIEIKKINPAVLPTPEFNINIPNKRSESLKWFEIEVEFETKPELIDELTFVYTVSLNGKLLTGEITHVNIAKGHDHYTVMYISPRGMEKVTGGKPLTASMVDNIQIEVKRNGMLLGDKLMAPKKLPNLERIPGLVIPKSETPFHVLWWDRYEAVKPAGR